MFLAMVFGLGTAALPAHSKERQLPRGKLLTQIGYFFPTKVSRANDTAAQELAVPVT
jgi:hypothetical protein